MLLLDEELKHIRQQAAQYSKNEINYTSLHHKHHNGHVDHT